MIKNCKSLTTLLLIIISGIQLYSQQVTQAEKNPYEGIDATWQNGSDRRDSSVFHNMKYFMPSVMIDINYTHSFNNPNDNTVVGSTALARNNEVQVSGLQLGSKAVVDILSGKSPRPCLVKSETRIIFALLFRL